MDNVDQDDDEERKAAEEFATGGLHAAVHFVKMNGLDPSIMLASLGSMFWTYLMMISPAESASANIDNALKYMNSSAEEARRRIHEIEWADKMTHNETGNA
jgi:hypothetical protein